MGLFALRPGERVVVVTVACKLNIANQALLHPDMPCFVSLVDPVFLRAGVVASWTTCAVMLWNFYDLWGGHYSRPLRRYWAMPYAPYLVLATNIAVTATAVFAVRVSRAGSGLFPCVVLGTLKVQPLSLAYEYARRCL